MISVKKEFEEEPVEFLDTLDIPNGEERNPNQVLLLRNECETKKEAAASRQNLMNFETIPNASLEQEFEQQLVQWFHQSQSFGCILSRAHLDEAALLLSKFFKLDMVKPGWLTKFIKRKNLRFNNHQKMTATDWFSNVQQNLDATGLNSIMEDPSRVWRCDQGLLHISKRGKLEVNSRKATIKRALFLFSASGGTLKPHLISKGVPMKVNIAGVTAANTEDGIVTHEEFARYLEEDFAPQMRLLGVQFPIVLFLYRETLHDHIGVWQTARQLGIILVTLHPDVARADKRFWKALDSTWSELHHRSNPKRRIEPLGHVLDQLRVTHFTEKVVKQSFEVQGLFPWCQRVDRWLVKRKKPRNIDPLGAEYIIEVNVEKLVTYQCRACRREGDEDFVSMEEEGLATLFKDLTGIVVNEESPSFICMKCKIQLESFGEFRHLCLSSQEAFEAEKDQLKFNESILEFVMEPPLLEAKTNEFENPCSTRKIINVFAKKPRKVRSKNRSKLRPIVQYESSEEKVTCNECEQTFGRNDFLRHWLYEHCIDEEPSLCSECGKTLSSVYKLERHLRETHGVLKCVNCERIDYVKSSKTARKNHKRHMLRCTKFKESYNYECNLCGMKYITAVSLAIHGPVCLGSKTVVCEFCGDSVKSVHLSVHTNNHLDRTYVCRYCPKTFQKLGTRHSHESSAHSPSDKPFHCAHCSFKFRHKHFLENHLKQKHFNRKRPAKKTCEICGAKVQNLRQHMNQHMDYRPYACEVAGCEARFRSQGSLIKHKYAHSKTRPYNCTLCTTGYYQTAYLRDHYKRTHGIVYEKGRTVPYRKGEINLPTVQETDEVQEDLNMDENMFC